MKQRRMMRWACHAIVAAIAIVVVAASLRLRPVRAADIAAPANAMQTVDFVRDIQPIFASACYKCHDGAKHKGGLRLDSKATAFIGGDSGDPSLVANDPEHSKIVALVRGDDPKSVMPPKGNRLNIAQVDLIVRWIKQGARWPDGVDKPAAALSHWSFTPPIRPELPAVKRAEWCRTPIDRFILNKLEAAGLNPAPEADKYTLCRRVYLDLIGLPPTPAEADAFARDASPRAYEDLVDRLQANPHYGERWARIWLDCARYADSAGYGSDPLRKTCSRYRDWVINAFNQNIPYDRFTIDQLAGDLLPNATTDDLIATGFNRNTMTNTEGGTDAEEFRTAAVKDRVETSVQVWMGLTVGCAQCHTHKYDPITNREYYQLFAIFNQTEDANRGDESPTIATPTAEDESKLQQLKAKIDFAEQKLDQPAAWADEQAKWEKALGQKSTQWTVLDPIDFKSAGGATLTRLDDGSILASGAHPKADTYTITAHADLKKITAFRLEALPDESLPRHESGRADNGGFVLSQFRVGTLRGAESKPTGRYVRIELPGNDKILHLAQVQIFQGDKNIARKAKAKQSSTDFKGKAEFAIDGNTEGNFARHITSHTLKSNDPWWEADLGRNEKIDRIVIWNRTDNGMWARLAHFNVIIFDAQRTPIWQTQIEDPPNPSLDLDLSAPRTIALKDASDSDHQNDKAGQFPASEAIEAAGAPNAGWAVLPQENRPHIAVFQTDWPYPSSGDLVFTLTQNVPGASIGRLRLSATTNVQPVTVISREVAAILTLAPAERGDAQKARLFAYFKETDPRVELQRQEIAKLKTELAAIKPTMTAIMRELPKNRQRKSTILIKGNFLVKGAAVEPAVLAAFNPLPKGAPPNRLGLAEWFVDRDNPLTARVAVNRFWMALFGIGIVETQEDFGTQGQLPSNQALLDWLAVEFRDGGASNVPALSPSKWDMKRLVKLIVTSAAYRQSSRTTPQALEKDPRNRLISRGPRRRLEAELVRDQALSISGLISLKMFGPSVFPPQPDGLWQAAFNGERTWPASVGEDKYRRGIYVFWRRTVPYPSMSAFDAPSREVCTLRRLPTSTPLQAFVTLNDPVYVECAQAFARRIVKEGGDTLQSKAEFALKLALAHPPEARQTQRIVALYNEQLDEYRANAAEAMKLATVPIGPLPAGMNAEELASWTVCANVLLNLDAVLTNN